MLASPESQQQEQRLLHGGAGSGRATPQSTLHHVVHTLFKLQLQADPLLVSVRAAGDDSSAPVALTGMEVWVEDVGHPGGPRLEVEIGVQPHRYVRGRTGCVYMLGNKQPEGHA